MMTMKRIDELRTVLGEKREILKKYQADVKAGKIGQIASPDPYQTSIVKAVAIAEGAVEAAVIEWAAQGCRETTCACSTFDDGSRFELGGFAGGAHPNGEFSEVTCIHRTKGAITLRRYIDATKIPPNDHVCTAPYHDSDLDGGALHALLAEIDKLTEKFDGKKDPPGWGLGPAQLMLLVENLKSGAEAIRKHLEPNPIDPEIFS
jgi:hypothetical protein